MFPWNLISYKYEAGVIYEQVIYSLCQIEPTSYFQVMFTNPSHHLPNPSIILHEALTTESLHGQFDNSFKFSFCN